MELAFQKTLGLLLLMAIGFFLQKKIGTKENIKGLKVLILSVALPATIFVALLKIELTFDLLILPIAALAFNFVLVVVAGFLMPVLGISRDSAQYRTLMMLLPSLAPGLSCFPFLVEYIGEDSLALAALADVGNKIFVLIVLYALALYWFSKSSGVSSSKRGKFKQLLISMINEPINMVILVAVVLLALGYNLSSFPAFLENNILRLSSMMMPLILIFIGLAVKIKWKELPVILSMLGWRAGISFLMAGLVVLLFPSLTPAMILLLVVFPQSAVSFWPFAHMSFFYEAELKEGKSKTFDMDLALSVLAFSLPFSTVIILGVFTFSSLFISSLSLIIIGVLFLSVSIVPYLIKGLSKSSWKLVSKEA